MYYKSNVYELYYSNYLKEYTYKFLDKIVVSDFTIGFGNLYVKDIVTNKKIVVKINSDFSSKNRIVDKNCLNKKMLKDIKKYGSVPIMFGRNLSDKTKATKNDVCEYIDNYPNTKFKAYCDKVNSIDEKAKKKVRKWGNIYE